MNISFVKPRYLTLLVLILGTLCSKAQIATLSVNDIDDTLLENANSVVRLLDRNVTILDRESIKITEQRIITVLNKKGRGDAKVYVHYDEVTKVKDLEVIVYDKNGRELKKYKKNDFLDIAAVDGISLYTDSRIKYLEYVPTTYPYTLRFSFSTVSNNTAFLPDFFANTDYFSSTESASVTFEILEELGFRHKFFNNDKDISVEEVGGKRIFTAKNMKALKPEPLSKGFQDIVAKAIFSLDYFHLEGVDGIASNWKEFGTWMDQYLLEGTGYISETTINEIQELVSDLNTKQEKVKAVYSYMQNRTRYISVQVGIGGWKPMKASQVDELGYGDCKALSNYTKSLLEAAGIPSYYTILYAGKDRRDIDKDFPSLQGNHAILAVPDDEDYIWLECTSQKVPTGFIAGFTDDRDVLVITPDGGKIVHTKRYEGKENIQELTGEYTISPNGSIKAEVEMLTKGTQYQGRFYIEDLSEDDRKSYYYDYWDYVNNITLEEVVLINDRDQATFKELVSFRADSYATTVGEDMLIPINALNRFNNIPRKSNNRESDIEIERGFNDYDEITIHIPKGYVVESLPEDVRLVTDYGSYTYSIKNLSDEKLLYTRCFNFKAGIYKKDAYIDFRNFLKKVMRKDNQKIVLTKPQ